MSLLSRLWHDIGIVLMLALICFFIPLETPVLKPKYRPPDINSSCRLHKPLIGRTAWVLVDSLGAELTFNREPGTDIHKVLSTTSSNIPEMIFVARVDKPGYTVPRVLALATGAPVSATRLAADSLGISSPERIMNVLEGPLHLVGCDLWETIAWERWDYNGKVFCFDNSRHITGDEEEHNKLRQFLQADPPAKFTVLHLYGFDSTAHIFWSNDGLQYREKLAEYVERLPAIENDFQASTKVPLLLAFVADHGHNPDGQHAVNTFNVLHATLVTRIVLPKDQQPSNTVTSALEQVTAKWQSTRKRAVAKASDLTDSTSFVRDWSRLGKTGVAWQVDLTTTTALVNGARLPSRSVGVVLPETVLQAAASQPGICSDISSIEGCAEILESFLDEAVGCNAEHFAHLLRIPVPSGMSTEDLWTWLVETRPHLYYTLVQKHPLIHLARMIPIIMFSLCIYVIASIRPTILTIGTWFGLLFTHAILFSLFSHLRLRYTLSVTLIAWSILGLCSGFRSCHRLLWVLLCLSLTLKESFIGSQDEQLFFSSFFLFIYFFGIYWAFGVRHGSHWTFAVLCLLLLLVDTFLQQLKSPFALNSLVPNLLNYLTIPQEFTLPLLMAVLLFQRTCVRFFPGFYNKSHLFFFLTASLVNLFSQQVIVTRALTAILLFSTSSPTLINVSLQQPIAASALVMLILRRTYDFSNPFLHWSSRTWQASFYILGKQYLETQTFETLIGVLLIAMTVWYCVFLDKLRLRAGKSAEVLRLFLLLLASEFFLLRLIFMFNRPSHTEQSDWTLGEIFAALFWSWVHLSLL